MLAREAIFDAFAIVCDVQGRAGAECLGRGFTRLVALAHFNCGEVCVTAGAVPISLDWLGIKPRRDEVAGVGRKILSRAVEQPARNPELICYFGRGDRADLELPLTGHNLGVDTGYLQTGLQAVLEMCFHHGPTKDFIRANATIVATLRRREAIVRPAKRFDAVE